ncbi:STAS domain-containing protein [Shewanella sp. Isolate11]|uniref:STAS domain-containing protein n=1 Tax=Shewanella sp. Isolate11 TaxID=2908530 RepID=UPI001EFC414E|nr:STAS domain-containing protein [Shewanella sp. Isolate11]MCG9698179.1 STAS domain-containing protein [Shewanella sp. Isolate11]
MLQFNEDGNTCHISGALSQQAVIALWPNVEQLIAPQIQRLDLSAIAASDSAGVALLLHLVALQQKSGGSLALSEAPPQLQKLIDLYDLQDFFVEEAK